MKKKEIKPYKKNALQERRSQKIPWSSCHIEYFNTGLFFAFVQVFSALFSHFILQPRTIRRAKKLCGRKEPMKKIENMEKKPRKRRSRRDAVSESIGLSDDDGSKMARKNIEILNAEESLSLVSKSQILKIFSHLFTHC